MNEVWCTRIAVCSALLAITALMTEPAPYTLKPIEQPLSVGPVSKFAREIDEHCGQREPGDTSQIIFTIESESDTQAEVTGCTRIAGRQFMPKKLSQAAQ